MSIERPKTSVILSREKHVIEKNLELIEKIKRIPFLEVDLKFDLSKLRHEVDLNQRWMPHVLERKKSLPKWYFERHGEDFQGQCIVDIVKDSDYGMLDPKSQLYKDPKASFTKDGRLKFYPTNLGDKMPYTLGMLKRLSRYINRTRLIKSKPGAEILWHSHHNNIYKAPYLRLAIFNLPIYTNENVIHYVRDFSGKNQHVFSRHLKEGKLYLFNSWHDHMFKNSGNEARIALTPYFNFSDQHLLDFLSPFVENYEGPLI